MKKETEIIVVPSQTTCHQITWDVRRAASGLVFDDKHRTVKKKNSVFESKSVLGTVEFSSGIHYWNIKIIEAKRFK